MFKRRPGLLLSILGILLTAFAATFPQKARSRLWRHLTHQHVVIHSISGNEFDTDNTRYSCQWATDEDDVIRIVLLTEASRSATRPSHGESSYTIKASSSNRSHNGLWIKDHEQPLKPGLNVYYFGQDHYGLVEVTPTEARQIINIDHWSHQELKDLADTLSTRLAAQQNLQATPGS